jgi:UDP-glucose 4-epimerase
MKILVTGGAGYIGSTAVYKLIENGHQVVIFDNLSRGNKRLIHKDAIFYQGDLLNQTDLEEVFSNENIEAVMHFAAFAEVGESMENPQLYFTNNTQGSLNLFRSMISHNVLKLIFSSTCATFGEPQTIPINEEHQQKPTNPYGMSKLIIEQVLQEYDRAHGLKSVCLRYFNAAGSYVNGNIGEMHDPESHLIPLVLKTARGIRESISVLGIDYPTTDGTCVRDYIHVEDLIEAHLLSLEFLNKNNKSERFNLGTEKGYSVLEIIDIAKKITGIDFKIINAPRRPGDPSRLIASSAKIKSLLGWQAKKSLEQIIKDAWAWEQKI